MLVVCRACGIGRHRRLAEQRAHERRTEQVAAAEPVALAEPEPRPGPRYDRYPARVGRRRDELTVTSYQVITLGSENQELLEGADNLCHLLVFVQDASGAVAPVDAEGFEVDEIVEQGSKRRGLAQGAVWAVLVIEDLVLVQQSA